MFRKPALLDLALMEVSTSAVSLNYELSLIFMYDLPGSFSSQHGNANAITIHSCLNSQSVHVDKPNFATDQKSDIMFAVKWGKELIFNF